jgi:4-hydroxy-4-methyl-2-oxoglutarate aldolase
VSAGSDQPSARLAHLDTCAVSDALDRLGLAGTVHGIHRAWACPRIAGRVVTVRLTDDEPASSPRRHLGAAAIVEAGPGDVIVMAAGGRTDAAVWGGLLSLAAATRGVGGVIVDGACRDVDDSQELGFPVYARVAVPTTARGRIVEETTGAPVEVAGTLVRTGDLAIADGSGVVFVAAERAGEVVTLAQELAARERLMAQELRTGKSVLDVMGTSYESMLRGG